MLVSPTMTTIPEYFYLLMGHHLWKLYLPHRVTGRTNSETLADKLHLSDSVKVVVEEITVQAFWE